MPPFKISAWKRRPDPRIQNIRFCIDRGGTFTDCFAQIPVIGDDGREIPGVFDELSYKLLSEDPQNYSDAPREGIRRILETVTGLPHPKNELVEVTRIASIRMATTVATNALLERKGESFALMITRGFRDLLRIGNQSRPNIFDLDIQLPEVLYAKVVEVDERVTLAGYTASGLFHDSDNNTDIDVYHKGKSGERVDILKPLDLDSVRMQLQSILNSGISNLAISFMHSYTFPDHELKVAEMARELGFRHITSSSQIIPMIKLVLRGSSACVDAFLTPCIQRYISGFASGFHPDLFQKVNVMFMQSDGGLASAEKFFGFRAILSGPAGGVVGYSKTAFDQKSRIPIIGFDMGGTSTDVSRFGGNFDHVFESVTAGISLSVPQLDIQTVAAGGGSCLSYINGLLKVGPESAGAHPGPACYRKGGPLAITDANLVLGRIRPEFFPKIFGPEENESLDINASKAKFEILLKNVKSNAKDMIIPKSVEELALGFIQVANEQMCRPIRALTQAKGYDLRQHHLSCFGGAGGQHACAIAKSLGIKRIYIHRHASILSAYGLGLADIVQEVQEPSSMEYNEETIPMVREKLKSMAEEVEGKLQIMGVTSKNSITFEYYANLRYDGTDTALMTRSGSLDQDFIQIFLENYQREFGFTLHERKIILDDVRVRGLANIASENLQEETAIDVSIMKKIENSSRIAPVYFESGFKECHVFQLDEVPANSFMLGPALLLDNNNTILVEPNCKAYITSKRNVVIDISLKPIGQLPTDLDPIQLSLFGHRFMGIAEQMGKTLQRTAVSTNIKERLDFSCALFSNDGGLVANAPHIPVHLGSMQDAVRFQLQYNSGDLKEGDVLVTNHPSAGGSHLPDITVITPVFHDNEILFFVASRGHHADIGGIAPGSMPPTSNFLYQEGASIMSFKLVSDGKFDEAGITKLLLHDPAQFAGCSGTRNLQDNISDLKAQVAANQRGIVLMKEMIGQYGVDVVLAYMKYIRDNAETAVKNLLVSVAEKYGNRLQATDYLDDGSMIKLEVIIDENNGTAIFDFTNSSKQIWGNLNAPKSITYSAVIYCLRCLVNISIPLNEGCLSPISIKIKPGTILCPNEDRAVVGGNVLTSQRVVDVIFKAFKACAASQGCMNNLTFGMPPDGNKKGWGYYETIAGGSGAGPNWNGKDGVHTHMTNTRITDPEILERRYPIILRKFQIRENSGGIGQFNGGNGIERELEFTESLQVSILSERRVFEPYGMNGGENGSRGENYLIEGDDYDNAVNLGAKCTLIVKKGDVILIKTPGGGGFGYESAGKI